MDLNLGHGFLPRIDQRNHPAVERCLGDVQASLYSEERLRLPWAIVEGPWADRHPPLLSQCADLGIDMLIDTQGWRYREEATFDVPKFLTTSYAPGEPIAASEANRHREFVKRDLVAQAKAGASAYIVPGVVPRDGDDDAAPFTLAAVETARDFEDLDPRPHVAFVGAHSTALDSAHKLIEALPLHLEGVYIQITPIDPMRDSVAKLVDIAELLLHARSRGFFVIGGRLSAFGVVLRAFGVDATDGGLGDGEKFSLRDKLRSAVRSTQDAPPTPMPGGRLYTPQIMRSVDKREWSKMIAFESVRAQLLCPIMCCLYGHIESTPERGREHSLHARAREAVELNDRPPTLRVEHAIQALERARSLLATINNVLREAGEDPVHAEFVDNQLAACELLSGEHPSMT